MSVNENLHDLPSGWCSLPFEACVLQSSVERKASVQQGEYKTAGRFPVVDQGSTPIAGYTDAGLLVHQDDLPIILFGDHTRIFKFLDFPFAAGADGTKLLRANDKIVDARFLYYALVHLDIPSRGYSRHFKYLREREVRAPIVLSEQRAIAGVLAKIQTAVEVEEKIVATLKELKAATMAKLFREGLQTPRAELRPTRFGDVPADWVTVPLAEVAHIQTGVAKGRRIGGESAIVELPYLRVANVQDGFLDLSEIKTIRLRETERQRYSLHSGDVLLTEGGDFDKLGRGYLWNGQILECVHQNHIFAVRTNSGKLLPEFFAYLAQSAYGKAYFLSVAHKTTNLACINSTKLRGFPVLLPPLTEQREIATALKKIDESIDLQATRLKTLKSLFSSMLHLLMTGRVRLSPRMIALQNLALRRKPKPSGKAPDQKVLDEIVRRIVATAAPEKIILFGSAARGEMGPDSDLDLLVVKACDRPRDVERVIRRSLIGIGVPKDVVVVTPRHLEEHKDTVGYIYRPALREGKVLYAA